MDPTLFWKKFLMWNQLLPVVHNDYNNSLSKSYSIRYQLVLLVDWLNLVGTRSNEVERNSGFFHVEAPHSSTRKRPEVRGRSWLATLAHLVPLSKNATFSASVHFSGTSIDCSIIFHHVSMYQVGIQNLRVCSSKCPHANCPSSIFQNL